MSDARREVRGDLPIDPDPIKPPIDGIKPPIDGIKPPPERPERPPRPDMPWDTGVALLAEEMVLLKYVGKKRWTHDAITGSGQTWEGSGDVRLVPLATARQLLKYPDQWQLDEAAGRRRAA